MVGRNMLAACLKTMVQGSLQADLVAMATGRDAVLQRMFDGRSLVHGDTYWDALKVRPNKGDSGFCQNLPLP